MADITMCFGSGCPLKEQCYRYTAKPDKYRQSYFVGLPYLQLVDDNGDIIDNPDPTQCKQFWDNKTYQNAGN